MSLSFSSLLLLAASFSLSVSAPTPEECKPLITPLSLADPSVVYGRVNLIAGYADSEAYKNIMKVITSSWMNITPSPSSNNEVVMYQAHKMNGTCLGSKFNITIDGNTATMSLANITVSYHTLPTSCDGCMLISSNYTARDLGKIPQLLNIDGTATDAEITTHGLYLMAKGTTVTDSDLEHFKKQASCLGFSGEPGFHYDPQQGLCQEDEVIMPLS